MTLMIIYVLRVKLVFIIIMNLFILVRTLSMGSFGEWNYSDIPYLEQYNYINQKFPKESKNFHFCEPSVMGKIMFYGQNFTNQICLFLTLQMVTLQIFEWISMIYIILT